MTVGGSRRWRGWWRKTEPAASCGIGRAEFIESLKKARGNPALPQHLKHLDDAGSVVAQVVIQADNGV